MLKACPRPTEESTMSAMPLHGALALDAQGRVHRDSGVAAVAPGALPRAFEALVCAELRLIGARTVDTPNGYLSIMTLRERSGLALELWGGAALRDDPDTARCDAAADALLGPWQDSAIVAGAARLVAEGTCRGAMAIDDDGVTSYGPTTEVPAL